MAGPPIRTRRLLTHRHRSRTSDAPGLRLPTRRALGGAALIALAAGGVLVAHRTAGEAPSQRWVVAARSVPAGHVLRADDLGTVAVDLPGGIPAIPAQHADDLIGTVTLVRLEHLGLLRPDDTLAAGRFVEPGSVEVSVEIPPGRAMTGTLQVGDRVDVLATDREGTGTRTVVRGARVSAIPDDDGSERIGSSSTVQVRLGLPDSTTAASVVDASIRSEVSLVLPAPGARQDR